MDNPQMSAAKDLFKGSNMTSVTQGWGVKTEKSGDTPSVNSNQDHGKSLRAISEKSSVAYSGQICVPLKETGRPAPPPPKFSLISTRGIVMHLFPLEPQIIRKINHIGLTNLPENACIIGSLTSEGWIIIWNLNSRRCAFEADTGLKSCSWASFYIQDSDLLTFVHSRTDGLFKFTNFPLENPVSVHSQLGASFGPHPGFCKPDIFSSTGLIAYPTIDPSSSDSNFCKLIRPKDFKEEATFPPVLPIVFVLAIDFSDGLKSVLVGCETGLLVLFDIVSARPVGSVNIHDHATSKEKCQDEVPFCCDFDVSSSSILIGTSHRSLYSFSLPSFQVSKVVSVTNAGTNCVKIRPDGKLAATGGTDRNVRVFTYPGLRPLAVLSFHGDVISNLRFFDTHEGYLLVSSSQDSVLAVWDIYSKKS